MNCLPYINDMTSFTHNAIHNVFRNTGKCLSCKDLVGPFMCRMSNYIQICKHRNVSGYSNMYQRHNTLLIEDVKCELNIYIYISYIYLYISYISCFTVSQHAEVSVTLTIYITEFLPFRTKLHAICHIFL